MFHTGFLSPTDQKCVESSTYWQFFYYRPLGKFRFTHLGEIVKMLSQELDIYIHIYIYMTLLIIDMEYLYQFNLGLIAPLFPGFCSWNVWKKMFFLIFKSRQVCDWLAKWITMLRFMDLRWPRVFRRSNVGLVSVCYKLVEQIHFHFCCQLDDQDSLLRHPIREHMASPWDRSVSPRTRK